MSATIPTGFSILRAQHLLGYQSRFRAVCSALGNAIGHEVEPHMARDYGELTAAFEKGTLGLAWLPPVTAARLVKRHLVSPIALPRRGGHERYCSVIVAHEDGPSTLDAFPTPKVAWVDPESAAGYLVPRGLLLENGVTGFVSEQFLGSHSAVVDAVAVRAVDLGATFGTFNDETGELIDADWLDAKHQKLRPVKAVAHFGAIPNDCIVVSEQWPKELQKKAQEWLLGASASELDILSSLLRTDRFEPVDDRWLSDVDAILDEARSHGLPALGSRRSHDVRRPK